MRGWQTPVHDNGRPTGMTIDRQGNLLVADTHYFRVLTYSPEGELLAHPGRHAGQRPGEFGFVTDAVDDSQGNLYVSEYGEYDRIQKFSADGEFLLEWGGHGDRTRQVLRPQSMAIDAQTDLGADACNHRIQVFDTAGKLIDSLGRAQAASPGELSYPYGLVLDEPGNVYVTRIWQPSRAEVLARRPARWAAGDSTDERAANC